MEDVRATNTTWDSTEFKARLVARLRSSRMLVDPMALPGKLKCLLKLPEDLDVCACGKEATEDSGSKDCWVLNHLMGLNEIVSRSGVELIEEQPGAVTLRAWKPCPRLRFSQSTFSQDVVLLLVKNHQCIKHFYWNKTMQEMTKCILGALSERDDVLSFSISAVLLSRTNLMYKKYPMPKCISRRILDLVKGCKSLEAFEQHQVAVRESFTEELGAALAAKRSLKKLVLSNERTIRAFLRSWSSKPSDDGCNGIVSLTLKNCKAPELVQLSRTLERNSSISLLDIGGDESYRLYPGAFKDDGLVAVANVLRTNASVKTLNLEDHGFGPEGAIALSEMLSKNGTITHLNINDNSISHRAAASLAAAVCATTSLKELKMWNCSLDRSSILVILRALTRNQSGLTVDLGDAVNEVFTPIDIVHYIIDAKLSRVPFTWGIESIVQHGCIPDWCADVHVVVSPMFAERDQLNALYTCLCRDSAKVKRLSLLLRGDCQQHCLRIANILANGSKFQELSIEIAPMPKIDLTGLFEALLSNVSIQKICFNMFAAGNIAVSITVEHAKPLPALLGNNKTLESLQCNLIFSNATLKEFSKSLEDNYALINFWFYIRDSRDCVLPRRHYICRRNRILQEQATHFLLGASTSKRLAEAFSLTHDVSALRRRVVQALGESEDVVRRLIKAKRQFLLANFFSIVGVVKKGIRCNPTQDGATQIDALNLPCLEHIAGFLRICDVK